MRKEIFKQLIRESIDGNYLFLQHREIEIPDSDPVTIITGPRYSGKTSLLLKLMHDLRKKQHKNRCIYIDLEDRRLSFPESNDMEICLDSYYELFPENKEKKIYFFFDGIQDLDGWELSIKQICKEENIQLYLCGLSLRLTHPEMSTSLKKQIHILELLPLSFSEFLQFNKIKPDLSDKLLRPKIISLLDNYLLYGGFPGLTNQPKGNYIHILNGYFNQLIYKDLIERYHISNHSLLKALLVHCMKNPSSTLSISRIIDEFKSRGMVFSRNTLYEYIDYFQENYVLFSIPVYRKSKAERLVNPKKIYLTDAGFYALHQLNPSKEVQYKNTVFLHLKRIYKDVFYVKGKQNVDFCIETPQGIQLIRVLHDISGPMTKKKEIQQLSDAMSALKIKQAFLITRETDEVISTSAGKIAVIPLYKWLLQCTNKDMEFPFFDLYLLGKTGV